MKEENIKLIKLINDNLKKGRRTELNVTKVVYNKSSEYTYEYENSNELENGYGEDSLFYKVLILISVLMFNPNTKTYYKNNRNLTYLPDENRLYLIKNYENEIIPLDSIIDIPIEFMERYKDDLYKAYIRDLKLVGVTVCTDESKKEDKEEEIQVKKHAD